MRIEKPTQINRTILPVPLKTENGSTFEIEAADDMAHEPYEANSYLFQCQPFLTIYMAAYNNIYCRVI